MKIHHLNLGTMCPFGGPLVQDREMLARGGKLVCHALLIESNAGLILVDAGFSVADVRNPRRFPRLYRAVIRPRLSIEETALHQIEKLGFRKEDVRHVLPTHLDLDHAGGIADFPGATVHLFEPEYEAAVNPSNWKERRRYLVKCWEHQPAWQTYKVDGDPWFGFAAVRSLAGLPPEILLVPLAGHTRGHSAVAVRSDNGWLLHAGDAYFHRGSIDERGRCPLGIELYQRLIAVDSEQLLANQRRLRKLAGENRAEVSVFCAHDPVELLAAARAATSG